MFDVFLAFVTVFLSLLFILFVTVHCKTNSPVNLYWDNKYSDSDHNRHNFNELMRACVARADGHGGEVGGGPPQHSGGHVQRAQQRHRQTFRQTPRLQQHAGSGQRRKGGWWTFSLVGGGVVVVGGGGWR